MAVNSTNASDPQVHYAITNGPAVMEIFDAPQGVVISDLGGTGANVHPQGIVPVNGANGGVKFVGNPTSTLAPGNFFKFSNPA